MVDLSFTLDSKGASTPLTLAIDQAVIAGWTGRDHGVVDRKRQRGRRAFVLDSEGQIKHG